LKLSEGGGNNCDSISGKLLLGLVGYTAGEADYHCGQKHDYRHYNQHLDKRQPGFVFVTFHNLSLFKEIWISFNFRSYKYRPLSHTARRRPLKSTDTNRACKARV